MRSLLAVLLVLLGVILIVVGVLYALGIVTFLAHAGPNYKHALLCVVLGIVAIVGANFVRRRAA